MPAYAKHPVPHLLGTIDYPADTRLRPDGDTVHLRNPVLLVNGQVIQPENGRFKIWTTGETKPKTITLKGKPGATYASIRFEGIDAPEEHYRATPFKLENKGKSLEFPIDPSVKHDERAQPMWKPATDFVLTELAKTGWACIRLDREVTDKYHRVLGYVYSSTPYGEYKTFITLELLRRGLAFPFVFESAGAIIPDFLRAATAARKARLGVWKHYHSRPLGYPQTYAAPKHHTDAEPPAQLKAPLNLPMVFRRVVDANQLKGLSLKLALQKYDAMNYSTGEIVSGDQYFKIPLENLIWAPHKFT
jgi:endonuclease YncB( thermonuclease family)